jgi:hypothetical protein
VRKQEQVSAVAAILLGGILGVGVSLGLWSAGLVLTYVPYFLFASIVGVLVWGFRDRFGGAPHESSPPNRGKLDSAAPTQPSISKLFTANLTVSSGTYEERQLVLTEGALVEGTLVESNGQDFDWYILDDLNYASFAEGRRFRSVQRGIGRRSGHIQFKTEKSGALHLVIDCSRLKNPRRVEVRLTRQP